MLGTFDALLPSFLCVWTSIQTTAEGSVGVFALFKKKSVQMSKKTDLWFSSSTKELVKEMRHPTGMTRIKLEG